MNVIDAILLPVLFIFVSAIAKKLSRGPGWVVEEDFSFGTELSIATITAVFLEITDLINKIHIINLGLKDLILEYIGFTVFMIVVFMVQIAILQEQKNDRWSDVEKRWILLGLSNIIGIALFLLFFLKIRREVPC